MEVALEKARGQILQTRTERMDSVCSAKEKKTAGDRENPTYEGGSGGGLLLLGKPFKNKSFKTHRRSVSRYTSTAAAAGRERERERQKALYPIAGNAESLSSGIPGVSWSLNFYPREEERGASGGVFLCVERNYSISPSRPPPGSLSGLAKHAELLN